MEAPRPHRPASIRLANAVGRVLRGVGARVPSLAPAALLGTASRRAGLEDFGDDHFRAGLAHLTDSLEREAQLSFVGRLMARGQILQLLETRLRLVDHRRRHPEVAEERIAPPLFVLGLPRTGTTLLYGLLAQDPAHRSPLTWEVANPCPPPRPETYAEDARISKMDGELRQLGRLAPGFDAIHPMAARLPQECVAMTAHDFHSVQLSTQYRIPAYEAWLFSQELRPTYAFHRLFLQHLQSQLRGERWVLKTPGHLAAIDALLATYPDAMIVQTHRDPLAVLGSVSSLTCVLQNAASDDVDPLRVGREQVELWSRTLRRGLELRAAVPDADERFFDVRFRDLLEDPIGCVRRIYAHFGLELGEVAVAAMEGFLADNPRDKHGEHRYALETFGIDPERDGRLFQAYRDHFGIEKRA